MARYSLLQSHLQLGNGHTTKTCLIRCTCSTWNPKSLVVENPSKREAGRTTQLCRLPGGGAHGGIQCPGLKVAVQALVHAAQGSGCTGVLLSPFLSYDGLCLWPWCDPELLVPVFFWACFSSLLSGSMGYSIAFQQIPFLLNSSQSWFLLLANETPDFVQLQLVSVNRLQMLFFFLHCLHSLCLCLPGSSTSNPEKEEWACRESDHSWEVSQENSEGLDY